MTYEFPTDCPRCKKPGKVIPGGVSKKTGKLYSEFMACETCRSDDRNLTWKSRAQWQYHADMAERARRDAARAAPKTEAIAPDDIKPGEKERKPATKSKPVTTSAVMKKPVAKKSVVKKAPSPAVLQIIFANKVIEALNALKDDERWAAMTGHGYDPKISKSYVLWVNALSGDALNDLGGALGVEA